MTPRARLLAYLAHNGPQEAHDFNKVAQGQTGLGSTSAGKLVSDLVRDGLIVRRVQITAKGLERLRELSTVEDIVARRPVDSRPQAEA